MKKLIFFIFAIFLISIGVETVKINLPIPAILLYRINLSVSRLQDLLKTYNTPAQNKTKIWHRLELTKRYINDVSKEMSQYESVITGATNSVDGKKNFVIGNLNKLEGNHNWVLVDSFDGKADGSLIIQNYVIQLNTTQYFIVSPHMTMSSINDFKNKHLLQKASANRQLLKFGEWVDPNSQTAKMWSQYNGFSQWKTDFEKKLLSWINMALSKPNIRIPPPSQFRTNIFIPKNSNGQQILQQPIKNNPQNINQNWFASSPSFQQSQSSPQNNLWNFWQMPQMSWGF